jgi:hypothetical protein
MIDEFKVGGADSKLLKAQQAKGTRLLVKLIFQKQPICMNYHIIVLHRL